MRRYIILFIIPIITILLTSCNNNEHADKVQNSAIYNNNSKAPVEAFGSIKSLKTRDIYIKVPTKINKLFVKNGEKVKKGQNIAAIDMQEFDHQKKQKEGKYKIANLDLQKSLIELKSLKEIFKADPYEMEQLSIQLKALEKEYENLQSNLAIEKQMLDIGSISLQDYKLAEKTVNDKKIDIEKQKLSISQKKSLIEKQNSDKKKEAELKENDIQVLSEKVSLAKEDLDTYISVLDEDYIKDGNVISDIENGIIFDLNSKEKGLLDDTQKLCSIIDIDQLVAEVNVSEEDIKNVKLNAPVKITPIADKTKVFTGTVSFLSNNGVAQNGEIVFPVYVTFIDGEGFLMPQLSVDVEISND